MHLHGLIVRLRLLPVLVAAVVTTGCTDNTASWTQPLTGVAPIVLSVWGSAPGDVWVVGGTCGGQDHCTSVNSKSLVMHHTSAGWTTLDPGVNEILWWVQGFSNTDLWIVGNEGTILHYDGAAFTKIPSPATASDTLFGIWGTSDKDLWAVGGHADASSLIMRWDGAAWTKPMGAPTASHNGKYDGTWFKVWGPSASDVWIVGQYGNVLHFDGQNYETIDPALLPNASLNTSYFTAAGSGTNDVYVVGGTPGQATALHWNGAKWSAVDGLDLTNTQLLTGVFETAAGDVVMTGLSGAKFVGRAGAFRDDSKLFPFLPDLHAAWMSGPTDIWAVGGNYFLAKDGAIAHYGAAVSTTMR